MVRYCRPCFLKGQVREASEIVDGVPWCDQCFAKIDAQPTKKATAVPVPEKKEEVQQMPRAAEVTESMLTQIRADREAGVSVNKIAQKHGLTWSRVNVILSNGNGHAGGKKGRPPKSAQAAKRGGFNGPKESSETSPGSEDGGLSSSDLVLKGGAIDAALVQLRLQREKIDNAILALTELQRSQS